ncbi:MAG: mechanosensitive ion channel [Gemmatimonadaceae bacterium]|nr:mechanosensitive ion channel [Gemmatimonadaceae bacterium]
MVYTAGLFLLAWGAHLLAHKVLLRSMTLLVRASSTKMDDVLLDRGVLNRAALLLPVLVFYYGADGLPGSRETVLQVVNAALLMVVLLVAGAAIGALQEAMADYDAITEVPIKSYAQILKILVYVIGGLMTVAVLTGRSPWVLLSGVGAVMAVIILVFRDTLLSLMASFTIASNRLVKVGDWIEVPTFGADGDVIEIALHTVKVQNWDKTITTIPTHKLVDVSFKNWRGMQDSGGRRIKRAIHIDMHSIRFCDPEMMQRFQHFELIRDYLASRQKEVEKHNAESRVDASELVNGRRLTNVGTFRAYVAAYLRSHPRIRQDMTFLIRQLAPTGQGLPLEIYVFTNTTVWADYEGIQSDIFDHLLAVVPRFELRVFQEPAGSDFAAALQTSAPRP